MTFMEACEILGDDIQSDGSLYNLGHYLAWTKGNQDITLDDKFMIKDLEAIVVYIKGMNETIGNP